MTTVDIIVPHFNGSNHVLKLLESIPNLPWLKVYLVDDHSSKVHLECLEKVVLRYEYVELLYVPVGMKGPGVARNLGIESSNADWLLFADADDFFTKNAFNIIKAVREIECEVVFFPPTSIVMGSNKESTRHKHYIDLFHKYKEHNNKNVFFKFYAPWSKLISRKLLNKNLIRFDDGIGGEDNVFSLKTVFYAEKIHATNETVYCIVENDNSLTANYSNQVLQNHFNSMCRYNDFLQQHNLSEYQSWMLGWVIRGHQISIKNTFNWLKISIKNGYPLNPLKYFTSQS